MTRNPVLAWTREALLRAAYERFGYAHEHALHELYGLYGQGLISYPRTDCGYLPTMLIKDMRKVAKSLVGIARTPGFNPRTKGSVWNDERVTVHHGIVPLKATAARLALTGLNEVQQNLYRLICERFVELFTDIQEAS